MDVGILALRLAVGLTLAAHGGQKLFGWFNGPGLAGTEGFCSQLGFRPAKLQARLSGVAEFGGGVMLALGFLTPLGAAAIIGMMAAATVSVHLSNGFFASNGGYELPFILAASSLAVAITGPGSASVDAALGLDFAGVTGGLFAATVGLGSAALALSTRRTAPQPAAVPAAEEEARAA